MENNFDEKRKDVDLSNIDIDSQTFQRKKLELDARYESKKNTEEEFYGREISLANNNDDEIIRRTKIESINADHIKAIEKLNNDYQTELAEIEAKYEQKYSSPFYYRWIYTGPVGKYKFSEEKNIVCGLSYYVKLEEPSKLSVYNDSKYSSLVGQIVYDKSEWREY